MADARRCLLSRPAAVHQQEAIMHVAGIDAHATYLVVAIVSNDGTLVQRPLP
jgi:hypothetical protein